MRYLTFHCESSSGEVENVDDKSGQKKNIRNNFGCARRNSLIHLSKQIKIATKIRMHPTEISKNNNIECNILVHKKN